LFRLQNLPFSPLLLSLSFISILILQHDTATESTAWYIKGTTSSPRSLSEAKQKHAQANINTGAKGDSDTLVVGGPKGLRIGLYYCFSPKGISISQFTSSHSIHPHNSPQPHSYTSLQITCQDLSSVFTTPACPHSRHPFSSQQSPLSTRSVPSPDHQHQHVFFRRPPWCT